MVMFLIILVLLAFITGIITGLFSVFVWCMYTLHKSPDNRRSRSAAEKCTQ